MGKVNREFIFVKATSDYYSLHKIFCDDIIAFESRRNHVILHLLSGNLTTYISLSEIADIFSKDKRFVQLHRSFLIAVRHIKLLRRTQIVMVNGLTFMSGDFYKDAFDDFLQDHVIKRISIKKEDSQE